MDIETLCSVGFPLRPGPRELLRGEEALAIARRALVEEELEPEMAAAWIGALRADFPSLYAAHEWPEFRVEDRNRYLKLRRMVRAHLVKMF